jgi:Leucine-rich repeat (LRR) protein
MIKDGVDIKIGSDMKFRIFFVLVCLIWGCKSSDAEKNFIHTTLEIPEKEYESVVHLQMAGRGGNINQSNALILSRLKKLESLTILGNGQMGLRELIFQLKDLDHLSYLSYSLTDLDSIPGDIIQLTELNYLDLSQNRLSSIDCAIFRGNIQELNLADNNLGNLPRCEEPNNKLKQLSLKGNINLDIDDVVLLCQNFHELEYLGLSNCDLHSIPDQIATLDQIRTLDLSYNHFRQFPSGLAQLSGLKNLILVSTGLPQWSLDSLAKQLPSCNIVLNDAEGF